MFLIGRLGRPMCRLELGRGQMVRVEWCIDEWMCSLLLLYTLTCEVSWIHDTLLVVTQTQSNSRASYSIHLTDELQPVPFPNTRSLIPKETKKFMLRPRSADSTAGWSRMVVRSCCSGMREAGWSSRGVVRLAESRPRPDNALRRMTTSSPARGGSEGTAHPPD